jgi:hypothetical protein
MNYLPLWTFSSSIWFAVLSWFFLARIEEESHFPKGFTANRDRDRDLVWIDHW